MCVKLPPRDLNPDPYPLHPTSTYTCGVTTAPRVYGGNQNYRLDEREERVNYVSKMEKERKRIFLMVFYN